MNKIVALAAVAASLLPVASFAAATPAAKTAPTTYACSVCHMKFTAAKAKADHYKDPMDGGKLVPVAPAKPAKAAPASSMGGMKM